MTKHARSASWKDIKTVLAQQSAPELLQLIQDLNGAGSGYYALGFPYDDFNLYPYGFPAPTL